MDVNLLMGNLWVFLTLPHVSFTESYHPATVTAGYMPKATG